MEWNLGVVDQGFLSPYRLTDKPVGYGPTIRGSNPRKEAIFILEGSNYANRRKTC